MGCHGVYGQASGGRKIFFRKCIFDLCGQIFIIRGVFRFTEDPGCFCHDIGRIVIISGADQEGLGRSVDTAGIVPVQSKPVTIMKTALPQIVIAIFLILGAHVIHPGLHAVILTDEDTGISGVQINVPGDDGCRIAPGGGGIPGIVCHRHYIRDASVQPFLLFIEILPEFGIKGIGIHVKAGGS